MLYPPEVEGASLPSSAQQVQDRGKRPLQDEGPSGEHVTDFILIEGDDTDMGPQSTNLKEVIQEQQANINALSLNLERAKWTIKYLEQRNKQLEDQQAMMELQIIKENRKEIKRAQGKLTPIEQKDEDREYVLEKVNIYLENLLEKANRDRTMWRCTTYHYMARNMSSKARIRNLKGKLRKASKRKKRKKEHDQLWILAEASLAHHSSY